MSFYNNKSITMCAKCRYLGPSPRSVAGGGGVVPGEPGLMELQKQKGHILINCYEFSC